MLLNIIILWCSGLLLGLGIGIGITSKLVDEKPLLTKKKK